MENHIKIFAGNANRPLAEKIAARVGIPLSLASIGHFPDGEIFVTFEETVRGRDVFIVQPTGMQPNEFLMELLIMTDAARRASAPAGPAPRAPARLRRGGERADARRPAPRCG